MASKRLEADLIKPIQILLKQYPTGILLRHLPSKDLCLCIEHHRYLNLFDAKLLYLGKYKKPNIHECKPNFFYIYKIDKHGKIN